MTWRSGHEGLRHRAWQLPGDRAGGHSGRQRAAEDRAKRRLHHLEAPDGWEQIATLTLTPEEAHLLGWALRQALLDDQRRQKELEQLADR